MKMKHLTQIITGSLALLSALIILTPNVGLAGAFTAGNLVVYRAGTGAAALNNSSTVAFLDEYTTSGTLVQSVALPTAASGGNRAMTCTGNATSEGQITLSPGGGYIACGGYDAAPGIAGINTSASST